MTLSTTLSVSIPPEMVPVIDERVSELEDVGSRSAYFRKLMREDIEQDEDTELNVAEAIDGNGETTA